MNFSHPKHIPIEEYNYPLPESRIALHPLAERDASKLLLFRNNEISEDVFSSLPQHLPKDSLLIFNNTKVIQARLIFQKNTGANIEIFCLDPASPSDYNLTFQQTERCTWHCLVGNLKKWKDGTLTRIISFDNEEVVLQARRIENLGEHHLVEFSWNNARFTFAHLLEAVGELPIPPYLKRKAEESDKNTYQTVYSKWQGSVAAPTAGLHFTNRTLKELTNKGIRQTEVTLHVGAGTFKPVKSATIEGHQMHSERISVIRQTIENLLLHPGKVIAVGTTSVRTLESLYHLGANMARNPFAPLKVSQWQPYQPDANTISKDVALQQLLRYMDNHQTDLLVADTQIIIAPGYQFRVIDGIVTNFHQPQSTLLLLVSALVGERWKDVYRYALDHDFRFLSYGDSSLLMK